MSSEDVKHPSKRSQFNAYNFLVCYLVSLGQIAFGHPASIIGTTLGESKSCSLHDQSKLILGLP
jgi:hypothetical protein